MWWKYAEVTGIYEIEKITLEAGGGNVNLLIFNFYQMYYLKYVKRCMHPGL